MTMHPDLREAINDAIVMFKDIKRAHNLPAYANVQAQYVALGERLEKLMLIHDVVVEMTKEEEVEKLGESMLKSMKHD